MEKVVNLSWGSVLSAICSNQTKGSSNSQSTNKTQKCSVRVLDTVFVDDESSSPEWYFTTKSGIISRKKVDNSTFSNIIDRFSRFALANPNNVKQFVGITHSRAGQRTFWTTDGLTTTIEAGLQRAVTGHGNYLQVYLRPNRGNDACYVVEGVRSKTDGTYLLVTSKKKFNADGTVVDSISTPSDAISTQMQTYANELIDFFSKHRLLETQNITAEFIIDDNEHVWLSSVSKLSVTSLKPAISADRHDGQGALAHPSAMTSPSALPALKPGASATGSGGGDPTSSSGSRPSSSSSQKGAESLLTREGSLLTRDGSLFRSLCGPEDLPGLRAWVMAKAGIQTPTGERAVWVVDMAQYRAGMRPQSNYFLTGSKATTIEEEIKQKRYMMRQIVAADLVELFKQSEKLLMGHTPIANDEEFEQAWQICWRQTRDILDRRVASADAATAEVVVCGNTQVICNKLASLRDSGFRQNLEALLPDTPSSELADMSSPYTRNSKSEFDLRQLKAQEDDTNTSKDKGGAKSRGVKKDTKYADTYGNNGSPGDKKTNRRSSTGKGGGGSGSGLNLGPDIEAVVRFAAEKEKQQSQSSTAGGGSGGVASEGSRDNDDTFYTNGSHSLSAGKRGSPKGKKTRKHDSPQYPPSAEEKLAELERMADGRSGASLQQQQAQQLQQIQQQMFHLQQQMRYPSGAGQMPYNMFPGGAVPLMPMPAWGSGGLGGVGAGPSGTEAQFMARQTGRGGSTDIAQNYWPFLSPTGAGEVGGMSPDKHSSSVPSATQLHISGNTFNSSSSLIDSVGEAMRDRIVALERQVATLSGQLDRKEDELEKALEKLRRVNSQLEATKKSSMADLSQVRESHEREMLLLKERHAKDMASMATAVQPQTTEGPSHGASTAKGAGAEANKQLLSQLDAMRQEQRRTKDQHDEERRLLQAEAASRLNAQERILKAEIVELRQCRSTLEDRLSQSSDDFAVMKAKTDSLATLCRQMELARDEAIEGQGRLRAELKVTQQSVAQSYRMEGGLSAAGGKGANPQSGTSPSGGAMAAPGGGDLDPAARLNEAKSEAKIRQLTNKLEFLKAQLASEQATAEEYKVAGEKDRQRVEDLRGEFRLKTAEMERLRQDAIEETERRVEGAYEERMREMTSLQARLMSMQASLKEAYEETAMAKHNEENARGAAAKTSVQQTTLRAEIEHLRDQLHFLREEREQEEAKSGAKQSQEATVRRLDNERQYLKSQLASEITLKNELHEALFLCQTQLADTNMQWKSDVENLKESTAHAVRESNFAQQRLHQTAVSLEAEVARLNQSNRELKEGFTKVRDQVRAEQLALENATTANRRLMEQTEGLRADAARLSASHEQLSAMHERQVAALNAVVGEAEDRHGRELVSLREELSKQFLNNSSAQKESIQLLQSFDDERMAFKRQLAATVITERFRKVQLARLMANFRVWNTKSVLVGAAAQFRGQMEELVKATLGEAKRDKEVALETLRLEMADALADRDLLLRSEHEGQLRRLRDAEAAERESLASEREELFQQMLRQEEDRWKQQVATVSAKGEAAVARSEEKLLLELSALAARHKDDLERAVREGVLRAEQARSDAEEALNGEWTAKMSAKTAEFNDSLRRALITADVDKDQALIVELRRVNEETSARLAAQRQEMIIEKEASITALTALHALEVEKLKAAGAAERTGLEQRVRAELGEHAVQALKQQAEQTEGRIRDLRSSLEEEVAQKMHLKEEEHAKVLSDKIEHHTMVLEGEKGRALKLEASKWKQALKDAEKRMALEVKQAHERGREAGREEREQELRLEMANYDEKKQLEQSAAMTDKLKAAMDEMKREHAERTALLEAKVQAQQEAAAIAQEQVVDMQVAFEREKTDAVIEAEGVLRGRLALEWTDRLKDEVAAALEQAAVLGRQELARHEELNREHEQALLGRMEMLVLAQEAMRALQDRWAVDVAHARVEGRDEREQEVRQELSEAVVKLRSAMDAVSDDLSATQDRLAAADAECTEVKGVVGRLQDELRRMERQHDVDREGRLSEVVRERDQLKLEVGAFSGTRQELHEMNEKRIRDLHSSWEEEVAQKMHLKEEEHAKVLSDKIEHHTMVLEQDRVRGLKLEASKWKQALKEAEKRLALEVKLAHERGRDERDQEMQSDLAAAQRAHQQLVDQADARGRATVRDLEEQHADHFKKLVLADEAQRQAAVQQAERDLTDRLNAEWASKLVVEVDSAIEKADAVHKVKLARQQEALEEFKRDMVAQTQRVADERNDLQRQFMNSAQAAERLQIERRQEISRMKSEYEEEGEQYRKETEVKHKRELEQLRLKLRNEAADEREAAEAAFEKRLDFEKKLAVEKLEDRLEQVHLDGIGQANATERRIKDLEEENEAATAAAKAASVRLRGLEETVAAADATAAKKSVEASLAAWQMAANSIKLQRQHAAAMEEMRTRHAKEEQHMRSSLQTELSKFVLATLKLSRTCVNTEELRKRMDASLRSYRVDDLNDKRRRIKVLEKDIERLGSDKDAYDEQRDDVEEEIDRLEEQVRGVEEEGRQHALLSTTQNGRINVAHARKKRRLDAELERLLETIEQRRNTIHELEDQAAEKARVRDEREAEIVTLEKDLVQILVEQQKVVLNFVEQGRAVGDGIMHLVKDTQLPWPPPEDPSMAYVVSLFDQGGPLHGKVAAPRLV